MGISADQIIELHELRIGNLLDYKGELVTVTMLSCDIDDEYEDQICFVKLGTSSNETGGWNRSLVNDLKRIPLTPEWLERCGFKEGTNYLFSKHLKLGIHTDYTYIGTITSTSAAYVAPAQYVHQLQHLYFALTGEELTIKEKV